jgi:hypothetical protein
VFHFHEKIGTDRQTDRTVITSIFCSSLLYVVTAHSFRIHYEMSGIRLVVLLLKRSDIGPDAAL